MLSSFFSDLGDCLHFHREGDVEGNKKVVFLLVSFTTLLMYGAEVAQAQPALGSFNPNGNDQSCTQAWTPTNLVGAPEIRSGHTAIWTNSEMIVWGGFTLAGLVNSGGRYNPSTNNWLPTTSGGAPAGRGSHTAVWTGARMIVWGGYTGSIYLNSGGRYDPTNDSWAATSISATANARGAHTGVWTGTEMIIWGGFDGGTYFDTGARYNPTTDTWTAVTATNAPTGRRYHTAVWTGTEMIIWGGSDGAMSLDTGARYNPTTDTWTAMTTNNPPLARVSHTAVWTGSEMIVWGGYGTSELDTGGRYNPVTNTWVATSNNNVPSSRASHTAVWSGSEMIVWGGTIFIGYLNSGGRYSPSTDSWTPTSFAAAPGPRGGHSAVWTGLEMIVWGGTASGALFNDGGRYCPQFAPPPTPTPSPTPTLTPTPTPTLTPTPTPTPTPSAAPSTVLGNISTRLRVETGDNVLIGGFIVTGTQSKRVIVRAIGPSLPVAGALADPVLDLRDFSGGLIRSNDNWRSDQEAEIIATGIPPSNDLESAIVATPAANSSAYTATVRGAGNGTGVGLVEVYDLDRTVDSKLANISTRGFVQTGENVLIGGLIVLGQNPLRVIVRAIGPSLPVSGALANPTLELHDGSGALIGSNDDWRSDQEAEIIATGVPPTNNLESAIVRNLTPGNYTAIVRGVNNTTGVALVEAYGLN